MCYKPEYLYKIREKLPIKKICLVLAIINAVANTLLFLECIYVEYRILRPEPERHASGPGIKIGGIVWGRRKRDLNYAIDDYVRHEGLFPVLFFVMLATAVCSLLTFIFSVLLCIGIRKGRPGFVKPYVVYGVIISCLIGFVSFIYLCLCLGNNPGLGVAGLCGCALHALYIVLVHQTLLKVREETMSTHIPLREVDVDTRPISLM